MLDGDGRSIVETLLNAMPGMDSNSQNCEFILLQESWSNLLEFQSPSSLRSKSASSTGIELSFSCVVLLQTITFLVVN